MQDQQAVNRVTREHCSSFFYFTAVLPSALLPIPMVTTWDVTPSPRYYREYGPHYRGFPAVTAVPITVQTSTEDLRCEWQVDDDLDHSLGSLSQSTLTVSDPSLYHSPLTVSFTQSLSSSLSSYTAALHSLSSSFHQCCSTNVTPLPPSHTTLPLSSYHIGPTSDPVSASSLLHTHTHWVSQPGTVEHSSVC